MSSPKISLVTGYYDSVDRDWGRRFREAVYRIVRASEAAKLLVEIPTLPGTPNRTKDKQDFLTGTLGLSDSQLNDVVDLGFDEKTTALIAEYC